MKNRAYLSLPGPLRGVRLVVFVAVFGWIGSSISAHADSVIVKFDDDTEKTVEFEGQTITSVKIVREGDSCALSDEFMCDIPREILLHMMVSDEQQRSRFFHNITDRRGVGTDHNGRFLLDTNRLPWWNLELDKNALVILLFLPQGIE